MLSFEVGDKMKYSWLSATLLTMMLFCVGASAKQYRTLSQPVEDAPDVVEFFSFYCGPCYSFNEQYRVVEGINGSLPAGTTVTRYHVSAMGKLGRELSEAWAVATIKGVAERIERPLFIAVQRDRTIDSLADIKAVFSEAGISPDEYESARHSLIVRALIARQDAAVSAFGVSGTPSVYVKGRYLVDNGSLKANTPDGYAAEYASLVSELMRKN